MKILIVIDQYDNLSNGTTINHKIYTYFRSYYNKFRHIHCPSNFIANQLKEHSYTAKLHVLIEAVKKSKYSDKIQLILGGKGQLYKEYVELSKSLKNPPIMKFLTKEELIDVLSYTDIYVHSADAEIEAISCLEAIASGNVPIISNSSESATVQFAMDEESLFEHGNSEDLAKKIDYYLDNPKQLEEKRKNYAEFANKFRIENSIKLMEEMFKEEIGDYGKEKYRRKRKLIQSRR